jgi:type III secretion system FlhB-like substrate exporter
MVRRESRRRGSRISCRKSISGVDFSKKIIIVTGIIFILSLLDLRSLAVSGVDISSYATQQILATGGIFGASIVFYLNKSKIENLSKGQIRFTLLKLRLELKLKDQIPEETYAVVIQEIDKISTMMESKLDSSLEDAINKDIEIQSFN